MPSLSFQARKGQHPRQHHQVDDESSPLHQSDHGRGCFHTSALPRRISEKDGKMHATNNASSSPKRTSGWGLWPIITSSSTPSSSAGPSKGALSSHSSVPSSAPSTSQQSYPGSGRFFTSSPPSPFGTGKSDHSPLSTPPDSEPSELSLHHDGQGGDMGSMQKQDAALQKSSSRNDIFPRASPQLSPAPKLSAPSPSPISKTSNFFSSGSTTPSPASPATFAMRRAAPTHPSPLPFNNASRSSRSRDGEGRPSYGRSNTEERERERARIRQSNAEIDFRLCPTKSYLLGEGRHCNVYLGSYRLKRKMDDIERASQAEINLHPDSEIEWTLCAIKRLHADRQSQLLGLEEAFALRRLGHHPRIIKLISVRDEVEFAATSPMGTTGERTWAGVAVPIDVREESGPSHSQQERLGMGPPPARGLAPHQQTSLHGRSTSDSRTRSDLGLLRARLETTPNGHDVATANVALHRRLASQPVHRAVAGTGESSRSGASPPVVMVAAPEEEETGVGNTPSEAPLDSRATDSFSTTDLRTTENASSPDAPRLLVLLELLPYSLSSYAKKNPNAIKWHQWKIWALQLSEAVEWLHMKGCIHADLKPENVLLTADLDVKLCDFNSALFPSPAFPLNDGLGLGSPAYGAPELTRGAGSGSNFTYSVDIWSLGAILYTLATGVEPFARARSMIDMLYRKRVFFESEENDRMARQSVAEGWGASSNAGSAPVSRSGSLRRINSTRRSDAIADEPQRAKHTPVRRKSSDESLSSVTSSLLRSGSGKQTSAKAISMLLGPTPPVGLLVTSNFEPTEKQPPSSIHALGHHRASSLGKSHATTLSPYAPRSLRPPAFQHPATLRRTTSYGGTECDVASGSSSQEEKRDHTDEMGHSRRQSDGSNSLEFGSPLSSPKSPSGLRLAVTAALAHSSQNGETPPHSPDKHCQEGGETEEDEEEDQTPYQDGSPSLILPGGDRLPDSARELLMRMLSTNPARRPTASKVREIIFNIDL